MRVDDQTKKILTEYPAASQDRNELLRLQEFFQRMKDAGLVRMREYDLPQPDTLGRAMAAKTGRLTVGSTR